MISKKKNKFIYSDNICVIGLGYVGIPLLLQIYEATKPKNILGLDLDLNKIKLLKKSINPLSNNKDEMLDKIKFTSNYSDVKNCNTLIITVPTPLKKNKPDYSFYNHCINELNKFDLSNKLICIETTLSVGDTEDTIKKLQKKNKNFYIVYSPEREDPGNKKYFLENISKLVSADNDISLMLGYKFYKRFIKNPIKVTSFKEAELSKILENSYRLINIAFINEFKEICKNYNVNVHKVIEHASTKPFGFSKFIPSIGAGGHCIPVDPIYLTDKFSENTKLFGLLNSAIDSNQNHLLHQFRYLSNFIDRNDNILFIGLSYKDGVPDIRESRSLDLALTFKKKGFKHIYYKCIKNYKISNLIFLDESLKIKKFKYVIITRKLIFDLNKYISKNSFIYSFIELNKKKLITKKVVYL